MMIRSAVRLPCVVLLAWLGGVACASAVIKIEFPVARFYTDSKTVRSAVVAAVDTAQGVVEIKPATTFKGGTPPARLRLLVAAPADLLARVAVEQPVVIFCVQSESQGAAIVHLADTWLLAQSVADANPPTLRIVQKYDAARSFPGRTASLARLLPYLQEDASPLADKIDPECLAGSAREIATLGAHPLFLEPLRLERGEARPALLAGTAAGVRLFVAAGQGYTDATDAWKLSGVQAAHAASADENGDGVADLILAGTNLLVRQEKSFTRLAALPLPAETEWLAAALADLTGDGKAEVTVLQRSGELVTLARPGTPGHPWTRQTRKLWDGDTASAAQFSRDWGESNALHVLVLQREGLVRYAVAAGGEAETRFSQLTGANWPARLTAESQPAGALQLLALDLDGNGREDALLLTPGGGVALLNRGFGAFCADYTIHPRLRPAAPATLPFAVTPGTRLAAGAHHPGTPARQNLLILGEDGRLFELPNTAAAK